MLPEKLPPVLANFTIACGLLVGGVTVGAETPAAPTRIAESVIRVAADATGSPDLGRTGDSASPADANVAMATPLWTKYAYFLPARFNDLPGWREDNLSDAWKAFRASCNVLAARMSWAGSCARSASVNPTDSDDVRRFLEREFLLYQIHDRDRSATGIITGYYEPLLLGSRQQGERYKYPVYGVPDDLLFLDARSVTLTASDRAAYARVDGRNVVPVCVGVPASAACRGPYKLEVGDAKPDIRDKKLRVRVDGDRIVPYYTRAQIETGGLSMAQVLVWVDDPAALYSMQVQGSGKVRLPDGQIVRLAFAEQNGHPFLPPVAARRPAGGSTVRTRGLDFPASIAELDAEPLTEANNDSVAQTAPANVATPDPSGGAVVPPQKAANENLSPEVEHMVELLLKGNTAPQAPAKATTPVSAKEQRPSGLPAPSARPVQSTVPPSPPAHAPAAVSAPTVANPPTIFSSDPSYVFFRQIPDSENGPLGALGVPLTAGRSVAVDPRTTPLGVPVFISTEGQGLGAPLNRLMLAQDTGGAIRGPVRADYFWGFGPNAGQMAGRMKESGRMWLLLPKAMPTGGAGGIATRGIGSSGNAECLVPDPEWCVE